ncbi:MAG: ammonium transporter [Actinobacteria bacterium]|nr:MAG: ammonium transporter [Actinomycetota bacterium]
MLAPYPHWLSPGDNAWQLTAATLVGLMSIPGLAVLYGGVMQKRWSVNSMMLTFVAFSIVLVVWVLWAFKMGFGDPWHGISHGTKGFSGLFANFVGIPGSVLSHFGEQSQANIPLITGGSPQTGPSFRFPMSSLVYFQFVFAAITPILMLGSVLGRFNFKAWAVFLIPWMTLVYAVNAFMVWGGGWWAQKGAIDFSGGYVIHLTAGVAGFVAAAVIGPRLARDREIDAPNNMAMVAVGAGLLWLGWNGFNGGDPYFAGADSSAAVLNTNLCTAVAFCVWILLDYATRRKPSMIGAVNGMIVGLVAITPAAGWVNGYGAMAIGAIGCTIVYLAYNYLSRLRPFRSVDDTLGVVYTHGFAGLSGGLLVGIFADPHMVEFLGVGSGKNKTADIAFSGVIHGNWALLKWQALAALSVIIWTALVTFILLKLVGLFMPLRMSEKDMEEGDVAVHGHEVYPADVPSLGYPGSGPAWQPAPAGAGAGGGGGPSG